MTARERVEWSSQDVGQRPLLSLPRSQQQSGSELTTSQRQQQEPQVTSGKLKFEAILSSNRHREVMTALVTLQNSLQTLTGQVEEMQKTVENLQNQRQMFEVSDQGYEEDCESVSQYLCRKNGREPPEETSDDDEDQFENENDGLFASNVAQHDPSPPTVHSNSAPRSSGQSQVETVIDGGNSQPSQVALLLPQPQYQQQQQQQLHRHQYQQQHQQSQQQQPQQHKQQQQQQQQQQRKHHVTSSADPSRESPWISNEDSFDESQHHHGWGKRG